MSKGILLPVSVILLTSAFLVFHWLTVASVTPSPLELVSSEADMWVGLDSGLGMVVRIKNRSDAPVELESLQAEMGCRAEIGTLDLPCVLPPHQEASLRLRVQADANYLCPVVSKQCDGTISLFPLLRADDGTQRIANEWAVSVSILRPLTCSHARIRFVAKDWNRANGSSTKRFAILAGENVHLSSITVTGPVDFLRLKTDLNERATDSSVESSVDCSIECLRDCDSRGGRMGRSPQGNIVSSHD